jgi:hypothetical protein
MPLSPSGRERTRRQHARQDTSCAANRIFIKDLFKGLSTPKSLRLLFGDAHLLDLLVDAGGILLRRRRQ